MTKIRAVAFVFCFCFCISLCGFTQTAQKKSDVDRKNEETMAVAINALEKAWSDRYDSHEKRF